MSDDVIEESLMLIDDVTKFSVEDKEQINEVDARIYSEHLKSILKSRHYTTVQGDDEIHLADAVKIQRKSFSNIRNGSVRVGFDNSKAYIANFIENGTRFPFVKRSKTGRRYRMNKGGEIAITADPFAEEALAISASDRNSSVENKIDEIIRGKVAKYE